MKEKEAKVVEAVVSGTFKWDNNRPFKHKVKFTMVHNENDYGTGNHILMEVPDEKEFMPQGYDVRYWGTSDIRKLARMIAEDYWGENMENFKIVKTYKAE